MSIKEIQISQLCVDMFVCELDLPWIKNPFFRQKILIKNESEISQLKNAGCKKLKIDTSKGADLNTKTKKPPTKDNKAENQEAAQPAPLAASEQVSTPQPAPLEASPQERKNTPKIQAIKRPQTPAISVEDFNARKVAALAIRHQTMGAINEINSNISQGNPIKQKQILPLVDNLISELNDNEQAILATLNIQNNQGYLNAHLYNTMALALSAGTILTQDIHKIMMLGQAALMHDIGWVKLPAYLIQKGRSFTPQEEKLAKQHVSLGLSQLSTFPEMPKAVIHLVASHHEQPNGHGYPRGLKDENLDSYCRLLSIVIRYDELTHGLYGNLGMLPAKAMKQLFKEAQSGQYDVKLVSSFIHLMGVYPIGSAVKLTDGSKGVIVHHQPDSPLKPQVMLYYDGDGNALTTAKLLDTKDIEDLQIERFIDPASQEDDPDNLLNNSEGNE